MDGEKSSLLVVSLLSPGIPPSPLSIYAALVILKSYRSAFVCPTQLLSLPRQAYV